MSIRNMIATLLMVFAMTGTAAAGKIADRTGLAAKLCDGLAGRMDQSTAPFLLRSFEPGPSQKPLDPALSNTAFTYDNALASIALFACGKDDKALRIVEALRYALGHDRTYRDGRVRNAYRAGAVDVHQGSMLLPGFWNEGRKAWMEDDYQVGSATGNLAWAALAFLAAFDRSGDKSYLSAASSLIEWINQNTAGTGGLGFTGGTFGQDAQPIHLDWKSTEHNLDVFAAAAWLSEIDQTKDWRSVQDRALSFLNAMWNDGEGRFYVGSLPGGDTPNTSQSGIDSELWPIMAVPKFRARADHVLDWVDRHYAVDGGFDFNDDRDGIWLEGTAQAALAFEIAGHRARSDALLDTIGAELSPESLVYATSGPELTTGLKIGPDSTSADFKYFRLPHIGATAWGILAAKGWNPFVRRGVSSMHEAE